ncbi:MAG: adenylate cyclase class IV [Planctomycetota bacterium]|jgi:adenylate cyclase class IV
MSLLEIEVRGPLNAGQYQRTKTTLEELGTFKKEKRRLIIDYSTFLPQQGLSERTLDIRARITNGEPEMIIKVGSWGAADARKEISVRIQKDQFTNLLEAYAALGYTKGMLCVRNSFVYDYQGVEFALVEVPGHSYFFEAEIESTDNHADTQELHRIIADAYSALDLTPYSDDAYFDYVKKLNKEANHTFDFDNDGVTKLLEQYDI